MSNKTERITIRVSPNDKEKIKILAVKKGVSVSELVLCALLHQISDEERKMIKG